MSPPPPPPVIPKEAWAGCSVILDINDGDKVIFARLTRRATVKIWQWECSLQPLVGRPFGSIFRVEPCSKHSGRLVSCADAPSHVKEPSLLSRFRCAARSRKLVRITSFIYMVDSLLAANHYDDDDDDAVGDDDEIQHIQEQDENRDNRSLIDNNTAQALSSDDIETMKRDGLSGDAIVQALIANSSTFGNKTLQSQEKYKLKKQKKYAPKLLLRRPSTRSICETYSKKDADIRWAPMSMRVDTLSLLLSMANIGAYSDVLVVDMVGGLVVGAVAERLGGTGYVCSTYLGPLPSSIDIIRMYNFSTDVTSRIVQSPLSDLWSLRNSGNASCLVTDTIRGDNGLSSTVQSMDVEVLEPSMDEHLSQDGNHLLNCRSGIEVTSVASKSLRAGKAPSSERMKYWKEHGFSSLIVAAPEHEVGNLVADLLPLLSYSAPFAVYHQYLEPLATCMHNLEVSKMAVGLQISEPWFREYQVLPSRAHPRMKMNPFGGYLLSGIRTQA